VGSTPDGNGACTPDDPNCFGFADGTACNTDNDVCTVDECQSNVCTNLSALNCDDGVICTDDTCDAITGCANATNDANCDDVDACTTDTCDAITDCGYTLTDACDGTWCAGESQECDGGANCLGGCTCDPLFPIANGDGSCSASACGNGAVEAGEVCDPGAPQNDVCCNPATCQWTLSGLSDPQATCGGGSDCLDPVCDGAGGCTTAPLADGTLCTTDGLFCNGDEVCTGGICASPGNPCGYCSSNPLATCTPSTVLTDCPPADSCVTSAGAFCDEPTDTCPICGNNGLDAGTAEQCDDEGVCMQGCTVDGDCAGGAGSCDTSRNVCICVDNAACTSGVCRKNSTYDATGLCEASGGPTICGDGSGGNSPACAGNDVCFPASGDGCDFLCRTETCGDSIVGYNQLGGLEECDPPNTFTCNGACSGPADCCTALTPARPSVCGNGTVEATEQCDDGGICTSDSSACTIGGPACPGAGTCALRIGDGCNTWCMYEECGNGLIDVGEDCDPPNGQTCDSFCKHIRLDTCGNNQLDTGEQCDDGNLASYDTCSPVCSTTVCGNLVVDDPSEDCDPPGTSYCKSNCTDNLPGPNCGNGSKQGQEDCDDGNAIVGDGCSFFCKFEACGNGVVDKFGDESVLPGNRTDDEMCDDGNVLDGDGCSALCKWECGDAVTNTSVEECDNDHDSPNLRGGWCMEGCMVNTDCATPALGVCHLGYCTCNTGADCQAGNECVDGICRVLSVGVPTACDSRFPELTCSGVPMLERCVAIGGDGCDEQCKTE